MGMSGERQRREANSANKFLKGLYVLAIDDDHASLKVLEALLRYCKHRATMVTDPVVALQVLTEGNVKFDLVISGVFKPYRDSVKQLKVACHKMGLPVIILSAYEDRKTMIKEITLGACAYWVKPARTKDIMNMWQHVVRKKSVRSHGNKGCSVNADEKGPSETDGGEMVFDKISLKYSINEINDGNGSHENKENVSELSTHKKPRMTWTNELHRRFKEVVHQIGIDNAVPKKILAMMGVDYITRESVASHLQKYRLYLKRDRDNINMVDKSLANAPESYNSMWNKPRSFNHYNGHGKYHMSADISSSNPTSLFTRINDRSMLGSCGALVHGNNMFSKDFVPRTSLLPNMRRWPSSNSSYASMSKDTIRLGTFSSNHSSNNSSYANIFHGNLLDTNKDNQNGSSFAYKSNVGMSSPINRLPVQSLSQPGIHTSCKRKPFRDIGNRLGWQTATKFPGLGHKDGRTSLGPCQVTYPNMNQLTSLATSSVGQISMCHNKLQNPMANVMRNTMNMTCTHENTTPCVLNNNISSTKMLNDKFTSGSASDTSSALPNLQINTSIESTRMFNGGGVDGTLSIQDYGTVHLETIADRLKYINDSLLEADVPEGSVSTNGNMPNEDFISTDDYLDIAW